MSAPLDTTARPQVRPGMLMATLGTAGAIAGLLIAVAYTTSLPAIERNREARIDAAIHDVLHGTAEYEQLNLNGGHVYIGRDQAGSVIGFAIATVEPGFQDPIEILVGYDPRTKQTLGLAILSSRETPGLGDKIQGKSFLAQFANVLAPITGRKAGAKSKPDEVEMITGATISSRAVIAAINKSIARWHPVLSDYLAGGGK